MRTLYFMIAIVLTGSALSCSPDASRKERLTGHWQAVEANEEGRPLEVTPEEIQFWFYPDDTYTFNSTLNYREAGRYHLRNQYLITTDTLSPDAPEKVVEIMQLGPDTLTFRMMEAEKERTLTLKKVDETEGEEK